MRFCLFISLFFLLVSILAQETPTELSDVKDLETYEYETDLLNTSFFAKNRQALRNLMPRNSVAILFANPVRNRSNDVNYEYHQDPNFYYLTGLKEPHAMLLLFKEEQVFSSGLQSNEVLFLQERDPVNEKWVGRRLGPHRAKDHLGIQSTMEGSEFANFKTEFETFDHIYIFYDNNDTKNTETNSDLFSLKQTFKQKVQHSIDKVNSQELTSMLAKLRQIKSDEELILLKKAINITCDAQIELMKALKPGMKEYESEAVVEFIFKKNGAEHPGFPSILGGGENSCILHYTSNRKSLRSTDLLVSDVGAEYHGYTADVTRTLPTDGHFSEEEKIIYNIVYEAQKAGIEACKVGNNFWEPNLAATEVISSQLLKLGIIDKKYKVREYFMHGTSHYLGLDVHDPGLYGPLETGNVITVEPGIYIPKGSNCDPKWWNIGIRIEDDILITIEGPENLSIKAPRKIEAIELLMNVKSSLED